ncbi:hypothetical protein GPA27_27435 [Aromatoleum toluolicum]|uniref:Uncharacterized protein n=1 Tax=Aromatoleum toluolicum TaxID=90060 RepID=A0ABX1NPG4_9RHOO|nr:hypothetical protein [Aromatoleum toluolicum]NMG01107.1 hypothetical protein [Aromatoleum toluolicum]
MANKIRTLVAALVVPFALGAGGASAARPNPVNYEYVSVCALELQGVAGVISSSTFSGKNAAANKDGLLSKVYGADQKVSQSKPLEAEGLLYQIADKANDLANQGKLSGADASNIVAASTLPGDAMTCVMNQQ